MDLSAVILHGFSRDDLAHQIGDGEGVVAFVFGSEVNIHVIAGRVRIDAEVDIGIFIEISQDFISEFEAVRLFVVVGNESDEDSVCLGIEHVFSGPVVSIDSLDQMIFAVADVEDVDEIASTEFDFGIGEVGGCARVDFPSAVGIRTIGSVFVNRGVTFIGDGTSTGKGDFA